VFFRAKRGQFLVCLFQEIALLDPAAIAWENKNFFYALYRYAIFLLWLDD
jgi:hypothetical protein